MTTLFEKHSAQLESARRAIASRGFWSAFPEAPTARIYGESAKAEAEAAFARLIDQRFELIDQPVSAWIGAERSPYGERIGITYPSAPLAELISRSNHARQIWSAVGFRERIGICLEILERLNRHSHLMALACRITTGQPYLMAFQSGGPHAQERALEAIAYAYEEMQSVPEATLWEKPQGKGEPLRVQKRFRISPRGIGVAVGCATFPTWNSYAGAFATLATGNTLILKPHPSSILPLAITARIAREVLSEQGFDPNVVLLAVDAAEHPITQELVLHPDVAIVDFTGGPAFGAWLRANVTRALLYTEEAGVNSVIIDSTHDFRAMCQNLAFSLSLYSGQMCTAPQNLLIPSTGIDTDEGHKTFEEVSGAIRDAVSKLLSDPGRAEAILGCIQSEATLERMTRVAAEGPVLLESRTIQHASAPDCRAATPLIRHAQAADRQWFSQEQFGPISYVIATDSTAQSIELARDIARAKGAISMGIYTTSERVLGEALEAAALACVNLSCNLTGNVFVNQNAAFSDYHVSGANPAGTACMTDSAFVSNRFRVAAVRSVAATAAA